MPLFARLLVISLILGLTAANQATAAAEAARYNQIHFQVERSRPVENDRMQREMMNFGVRFYKKHRSYRRDL